MKIIGESKITEGLNDAYLKLKHNAYFGNGFQRGVYFAEVELQNLAIEFAKYCHAIGYVNSKHIDSDLFNRFIENRNK